MKNSGRLYLKHKPDTIANILINRLMITKVFNNKHRLLQVHRFLSTCCMFVVQCFVCLFVCFIQVLRRFQQSFDGVWIGQGSLVGSAFYGPVNTIKVLSSPVSLPNRFS